MTDELSPITWPARLALMVFGLVLGGLILEGLVRVFFQEPIRPRFVTDSGFGVRANQPNVKTRHVVPGEYDVGVTTNSAGMRDATREYSFEKEPGVVRVLLLGDSFVFGHGVEDEQVVSSQLESELARRDPLDRRFQVLNLAVSGFGQAELLVTYRELGRRYKADYVVLFYFDNDVGNNSVSALFALDGDSVVRTGDDYLPGVAVREVLYETPVIRHLFTHSQAWNLVRNRLSAVAQASLLKKRGLARYDDVEPEAVELTKALFRQFVADIQADSARPVVAIIPSRGDPPTSNFPLIPDSVSAWGVHLVDGRDFLDGTDYYARDSHWRPSGHRKMASELSETILEDMVAPDGRGERNARVPGERTMQSSGSGPGSELRGSAGGSDDTAIPDRAHASTRARERPVRRKRRNCRRRPCRMRSSALSGIVR